MISTDNERTAEQILAIFSYERNDGQQLLPGDIVVPFVFVEELAAVTNWSLDAILDL